MYLEVNVKAFYLSIFLEFVRASPPKKLEKTTRNWSPATDTRWIIPRCSFADAVSLRFSLTGNAFHLVCPIL